MYKIESKIAKIKKKHFFLILVCLSNSIFAATGDACATAESINPGSTCNLTTNKTISSTLIPSNTPCNVNNGKFYWLTFNTGGKTNYIIKAQPSTTTSTLDLTMELYEGTCGTLNRIVCKNSSGAGALEEYTASGLKKYTDYYILVYHSKATNPSSTIFNFCITDPTPINDECSGAQIITPNTNCNPVNGDLLGSTKSTVPSYTSTYSDIWFKFTATTDIHYITISGQGDFRPVLQLFSSTSPCSGLVSLGTTTAPSTAVAKYTFSNLLIGKEYYYRIYHTTSGTIPTSTAFTTCVENGILNDNCSGAYNLLPGDPGVEALPSLGIVSGASLSTPATSATCGTASHANEDVWYSFKPTNQKHFFKLTGTDGGFKPCMELLSGSCPNLSSLKCLISSTPGGTILFDYSGLDINQTYYLRVYNEGTEITNTPNFEVSVNTPPKNDDCLNAKEVTVGPTCTSEFGDGSFASKSPLNPTCTALNTNNDDIWFKFKADTTLHFITVNATDGYDPVIEVFKDDCNTSLMCDDASFPVSSIGSKVVTGLVKGKYYYYRIFDIATTNPASMAFTTCVVNVVENDRCENAKKVSISESCKSVTGDGTYATQSLVACSGNANDDVWYKFTATQSSHFISVTPSLTYDPVVQVFKDCINPLPAPNVFCKDAEYQKGVTGSTKVSGLNIGTTYYYRVYDVAASNPSTMGFSTCVTALPENDDCTNAKNVYPGTSCSEILGNGSYATESLAGCTGNANDDLWYKFTAQESKQFISVNPDDSKYDPVVQIFSACGTPLNSTSCNDNSYSIGNFGTALVTGLTKNSNYYYRVFDKTATNQDTMTFKTCVVTPVVNDDCAGALEVTVGATCNPITGDGTYASQSLVSCNGGDANDDVWFKFKATKQTQFITVTPDDSKYKPVVQVFSACGTAYTPAVCSVLNTGKFGTTTVSGLQPGTTYYYRVYDENTIAQDTMTFKTCVVEPVKNDECGLNATLVTVGQTCNPIEGDGTYATKSNIADCGNTSRPNDDVWFSFVAANSKQYINVFAQGTYNPVVQVFSACGTPLTGPVCDDSDYPKGAFGTSAVSGLSVGQTYYYRVYDTETTNNSEMKFTTCVVNPAINDDCANAKTVSVGNVCSEQTGDGTYATQSLSAPSGNGNANDDLWYKFRPTSSTHILYVTSSKDYDPVVQLYSACPASTATEFKYDGATSTSFNNARFPLDGTGSITLTGLSTTQDYFYRVYDTKSVFPPSSPLSFNTCVTTIPGPPENDEPCKAKLIYPNVNCKYSSYSNLGATTSAAIQPPGCGDYKGADVWFKVVVPFSGQLTFDTDQEGISDADMAIYSGKCNDLTLLSCDDNSAVTGNMPKIMLTDLIAGDTVYLRIWEKGNNDNGSFGLCVTKPAEANLVNGCSNLDFEGGLASWFGTTGKIIAGSADAGSPNYSPTIFNSIVPQNRFQIETGGIDKYGGFPKVFQGAGSLRLGEGMTGNKGQSIEQYFTVSKQNSNFVYNYAAVLQSGNHPSNEQPYFKVDLYNDDGTPINCGEYLVAAPKTGVGDAVGFLKSPASTDVIYKPWTKVSIDLSNYIGQNVHVRFSTGSCSHTQHFGYVYLDCACSPFQIITPEKVCKGDTARFYAPKGAKSYSWRNESGTIVYTTDTDSLIIKTTNTGKFKVFCDVEMFGTSLCKSILDTTYEVTNSPILKITHPDPICAPSVLDLFNPSIVAGSTQGLTYSYLENDQTTLIPDASKIDRSGTFYIKGERSPTCLDIQPVNVKINPIPKIENKTTTICSGDPFTIKPINSPPADVVLTDTKYKWTVVDNPTVSGESDDDGTGKIEISQTLTNNSNIAQNVIYTVTPFTPDCDGLPFTLTVTVNPAPKIADKLTTICSNNPFVAPANTSTDIVPNGTTYTWLFTDNPKVTNEERSLSDESSIKSYINKNLINESITLQSVDYTVTPKTGTCNGTPFKFTVNINPTPKIADIQKNSCTNAAFDATPVENGTTTLIPQGTSYTWLAPTVTGNISGGSIQSTKVSLISQTLINPTTTNQTATYVITANSNTIPNCTSTFDAVITVEPKVKPVITCGNYDASSIEFNWNSIPNATFKYQYKIGSGSYNTLAPTTNLTNQKINGLSPGDNVTIKVIPENILCPLEETQLCSNCAQPTIVNNDISSPNDFEICVGETIKLKSSEIPTNDNQWSFETNGIATNVVQSSKDLNNITGVTAGSTDIYFTNNTGCKASIKLFVRDLPSFTPTATSQCENDPLYLQANYSGATKVVWSSTTGYSNNASIDSKLQAVSNASITDNGTYSVEVTNSYGCKKTKSVIVSINPLPTVTAGPDKSICIGASTKLNGFGANTYTWDNNVTEDVDFSPTVTKTYTVTGTDLKGCKNTGTIKVTVNVLPNVSAGTDQYVCKGSPLTLTGSGASTYTWDGGVTDNVAFNPTIEKDYTVTGKDANDCINTDVVHVYINPLPTFTPTATSQCENDPLYLQANYSGATSVVWSSTTGYSNTASTDSKLEAVSNASISDNGTYSVEVTDGNGCKKTESILVTINPLPSVSAGVDQAICIGSQTKLVGLGGVTYNWNNGVDDNIYFSPTATKKYTVIGTDSKGCKNSDDVIIKVNPLPIVSAGLDIKVCIGGSVTLYGTGASSYTWDGGITDNVAFYPTTDKDYTLTGKDANDCINTDVVHVTVNQLPEFIPTATSQCLNDPLYVHAHFTNPKLEKWSGPNGFIKTCTTDEIVTAVASASLIDNGPYSVEVIDQNDCKNTKTVNVTINPLPTVSAGVDQSICIGSQTKLIGSGAVSYTWNNGVVDNTDFSPTTTKTYTVIGTDSKGCKNTDQVEVKINPLPNFTLSVNAPCEQETLSFTVDLSSNPSTAGIASSIWTGPNGFNSNIINPTIDNATASNTGQYTLTIKDNNLCSRSKSINATISLIDKIQFADVKPKCVNDSPFLLPVPNIKGGTWTSNDNASIQDPYKGLFDPAKSKPDQDYKVEVTYSTKTNVPARKCPSTLTKVIFVNPIPDSTFHAINPVICIEDTLHLVIDHPNQNVNYTWDLGNGTQIKQNTDLFDYVYPKSGDFTLKLKAELGNCKVSKTIEDYIHVIAKPTYVDFTQSEMEIDFYNPEILFKSYTNGKYLLWNFGDGTSSTYKNPTHKFPEKPGEYIIDLTASNMDNNYCSKTVTRSIFMPEPVIYFIPNTFTPNGDELNNVFQPIFSFGYDPQHYSFYIYNRWGQLIFESHDTKIGWDGTFGDNLVANDTYIWKLEFKEKLKENKHFKTGHVNVFR